MLLTLLLAGLFVASLLAVLAERLLPSILWLAGASVLLATALYTLGAFELAVIELSVGAGLVTVLYVFAVNVAGANSGGHEQGGRQSISRPFAAALVLTALVPLGWLVLSGLPSLTGTGEAAASETFASSFWGLRSLDVLLQLLLIVTGIIGVLGLLGETKSAGIATEAAAAEVTVDQPLEEKVAVQPVVREKEAA